MNLDLIPPEIRTQVGLALAGLGAALLAGKSIRRLFLLPFEYFARKTPTHIDDVIVKQIEEDLGVKSVLEEANATDTEK